MGQTVFLSAQSGWYDPAWKYRQEITIDSASLGMGGNLSAFPFLIKITGANNLFTSAQSDGDDILFTTSDGTTKIPHEIEYYEDTGSTELDAWVKVQTLYAGSDTVIYMYYGNSAASNQEDAENVWDSDYAGVWHLNEAATDDETTAIHYDSTANQSHGSQHGNGTLQAGKIAQAQEFDGSDENVDDYIDVNNFDTNSWSALTVEVWYNWSGNYDSEDGSTYFRLICKANGTSGDDTLFTLFKLNDPLRGQVHYNSTVYGRDGANMTAGGWHYAVLLWDGVAQELSVYMDGSSYGPEATAAGPLPDSPADQNLLFGDANAIDPDRSFMGSLDEIRISHSRRSNAWLAATYNNQNNPSSYCTFREEIVISGTVYTGEGTSPVGAGKTVALSVNGGTVAGTSLFSGDTDSNGMYELIVPTANIAAGNAILLFIDGETEKGATVSVTDGGNLAGMDIYQNHVIVRHDNGGSMSNTIMAAAHNGDTDIPYSQATPAVTTNDGTAFYVPAGQTFQQNGNLSAGSSAAANVKIQGTFNAANTLHVRGNVTGSGTLNGGTAAIDIDGAFGITAYNATTGTTSVGGDWTVGGFTHNSGTVAFDGTGVVASESFSTLRLNGGTRTATGALTITAGLILASGSFSPGTYNHAVAGNWNDSAVTFIPPAGTITLTSTNAQITQGGTNNFHNLAVSDGAALLSSINVDGDLAISSGDLDDNGYDITIIGSWNNAGAFTAETGCAVYFLDNTVTSTITGDNTFDEFYCNAAGKILEFEAGSLQTINVRFDIGVANGLLTTLKSTIPGIQWRIDSGGANNVNDVIVSDSDASPGPAITATNSVDEGNNLNWIINPDDDDYLWQGGDLGDPDNWQVAANWDKNAVPGGLASDRAVIPASASVMPVLTKNLDTPAPGDTAKIFINDGAILDTNGFDIINPPVFEFENFGIIRKRTGDTITLSDTNSGTVVYYDASGGAIQDYGATDYYNLGFDGSGQTFTLGANLVVAGDLEITAGTFDPGAYSVTVYGDLVIRAGGAMDAGIGTLTVGGDVYGTGILRGESASIDVTGDFGVQTYSASTGTTTIGGEWGVTSFSHNTGTVSFDAGGTVPAITFYNLGVSAGTRTASGNLTVQGNLTINNPGSLSMSGHNLAVAGNLGGTGTLAGGSGTIDVNGSLGVANYTATSGYTYAGGNWNVTGSFVPGTGTVICDGAGTLGVNTTFFNLTIPSGASFDTGGNSLDISNTFEVQGILYRRGGDTVNRIDTDSGTVTYRTSGGNIQTYTGNDYYNLTIDEAGQTFSLPAGIGVANNLAISNGTLNPNNHTITVGGSWSNAVGAVGFTYGTSTVTFTDASRISVVSGTTTFSNLTCSTPSKTIRFESGTSQTITDSFVIQGELGGYVTLEGTSAATWTLVNSTAAGTADYAAIQYSTVSAPSFTASNSMDNGNNNANWIFSGTVYRWVSSGSTSWTTAANWSPSTGYPQTNDTAIIQATGAAPALAANRTVTNLEIREGAALDIAGYTLTINGSFENRGTLRRYRTASSIENKCTKTDTDSGTVQYISGGAGTMIQDYGSPDYYNLILDIGGSVTVQRSLTVTGDFGFTSGTTVNAGTNFIAVGGNWTNGGGTLNHSSTVYFNDDTRTSTISGNTTFNNLSCTSPGKTILFEGISTQAVNGTFTIQGAVGDYVILDSTDANQWIINTVNADVDYARVQDSDITNATVITADSSIDDGNNDTESGVDAGRWSFPGGTTFFTWTGSGGDQNWDNTGNWSGGVDYPQAGDTAVIPATGNPPVMNADVTVETLTIQAGGSLDTDGYSLTVTGDFDNEGTLYRQGGDYVSHTDTDSGLTIYRTTGGTIQDYGSTGYDYYDLTIDGASFTLTGNLGVAGDLAFSGSGTLEQGGYSITAAGDVTGTGTLSGGTGTIDVNGNISVSTMTGTTGVASIAGDWNVGAFTHNGGTVRFDGSGTLTPGTGDFWNLENQTGTRTLSGTVTAANNLAISGGTLDAAGNTINVGGDWTNNGTFTHGNNTVIFIDENKPSAITGTTGFYNFTCSTPGKTLSFGANETQTIQNNFVIQGAAGDLIVLESTSGPTRWNILNTLNTENVDFADIRDSDNTGGDTITADDSIGNGNNINWTINQTFFTWVGGTGGALTSWNTGTNWFPQVVPGAGGTVVIPFGPAYMPVIDTTPVTVENITIEAGASLDTGGNTLTINSTFQNEGTLYRRGGDAVSRTDADSGAVVYGTAGGGIQTYAGPDYYDLQINGASQTFTLAASCEVANDIDIIAGTLSASGNTITLSGDWTVSSSALYTAGGGAVVFDSAAGQSCVTGGSEFANLTKQGGSRLTVASYNCTVSGTLTIGTAADIVDMTNRSFSLGAVVNNGTLECDGTQTNQYITPGAMDVDSGTVLYNGSSGGTIRITECFDLEIDRSGRSFYLSNAIDVNGSLTITAGTLNANGRDMTVAGNWNKAGGFTAGSGTVTFDTAGATTIYGSTTFNDFTCTASGKTLRFENGTTQTVNGTFTVQGTVGAGNEVTLEGINSSLPRWEINAAAADVQFAAVEYSDASANPIDAYYSTDNGNNTGWNFYSVSTWEGDTAGSETVWELDTNWNPEAVPGAGSTVVIPTVAANMPVLGGNTTVDDLTIESGASLDTQGNGLTITTAFSNEGTLYRRGGDSVSRTDTDSGLVVYRTDDGGIQDYGSPGADYYDLAVDSGAFSISADLEVAGTLTIAAGASLDTQVNSITITTAFSNEGTLYRRGGDSVSLTDTDSGLVVYRTDDGGIQDYGGVDYNDLTVDGAAFTIGADLSVAGDLAIASGASLDTQGSGIDVTTAFNNEGTLYRRGGDSVNLTDTDSGLVVYRTDDGGIQDYGSPGADYYDLTVDSGAFGISADLEVAGDLTIASGASLDTQGSGIAVTTAFSNEGTLYRRGGDSVNRTDTDSGLVVYRTTAGGIQDYGGVDYNDLTVDGAAFTAGNDLSVSGDLSFANSGTLGIGGNALSVGGDISGTGTLDGGTGSVAVAGSMTVTTYSGTSGTTTVGNDWGVAAYTHNDGTVVFDGTGNMGTGTFYDLENASGTRTMAGVVAVENGLTITGGTIDAAGNAIDVSGNWTNDVGATGFTHGNNTVSFTDAGKTSVITGDTTFNNFTCNAAGKTLSFGAGDTQRIEGSFTIQGTSGAGNMIVLESTSGPAQWIIDNAGDSEDVDYADVYDSNNSAAAKIITANESVGNGNTVNWVFSITLTWVGGWPGAETVWEEASNWSPEVVPNASSTVIIPDVGAANMPVLGGDVTVTDLTIQLNASLDAGAYDLSVTGTFTNNGTLYREAGGSVSQIDAGAGITEYRTADGAIQDYGSPGVDYSNLRINGVAATLGSDLEVSGNLVFAGGGTLGIGGNTLSVGGDISGTGTLAGGAGSVSVTGSMTVSAYSGTSGTTTVGNDWGVAAYTHNDGTVVFDGTGNLGTGMFYDLENASGTRTLTGAVAVENGLTITGGTIDADGNSIDVSGNWTNDAGATGFTHGNNMVSFTDAGKTSVITGGTTFYDFTCTAAGKTIQFEEGAAQAQTVEHTFTIQGTSGGGNAVTLARSGSTTQWYINVGTSSSIEYVAVSYSNASGGIQIDAYHSTNNGNNTNWNFINDVSIVTRQTIDSDADGFIDRIRIVTDRDINDVFDGLTMTVSGYTLNTITPFETGGGSRDSEFFINLVERDTPDTGATPGIRVTYNDSLMDDLTESVYLAIDAFPTPADDNAAPILLYTLAAAGGSNMYIRFSEYVYGNATMSALIDENDFNYAAGTGITPLTQSGSGVSDCFLRVGAAFTEDEIAGDTFNALAGSIFDQTGTLTVGTAVHPVSYLGLGVIAPAWATDGTDTITAFDGTEGLPDADITLEASILAPSLTGAATRIHYDVNVPSSFKNGNLWLPASIPVLVPAANTEARDLAENSAAGALRDYIVPESDSEIVENVRVEFILQVGTVFCARVTSPDDPRTVRPWAFEIKGITWQSDNVTILNNVINPGNGDTTTLLYKLEKSGIVTIMVFDLKGDIVDVLQRGRQNQGEYTVTWDGRNRGNRIVASGVYFIKIVAPGIEEIRKVLVVK